MFAKPYSPESTGKVERWNRVVNSFLAEAQLEKPLILAHLNKLFWVWLDECYQNKPHYALGQDISPTAAYNGDQKPIRFLDAKTIANAFLHSEERKVDKAGCISFMNKKYEAGLPFIGCNVSVVYDPADISTLTLEYAGHAPWQYAAIRQRIDLQCKLAHFDRSQVGDYVKRHLIYAGADRDIFSDGALDEIFLFSSGAARMVNKLCTHCLLYGAQNERRIINDHMVKLVIQGEVA
ncbi:MAG: Mu transposase C-terminal domain-containing protein [Desulfotomaculaceae bacterium]|nr:Mu transposase C-terminal domain-containing protein [Desulfotomaculaceae bacterium]